MLAEHQVLFENQTLNPPVLRYPPVLILLRSTYPSSSVFRTVQLFCVTLTPYPQNIIIAILRHGGISLCMIPFHDLEPITLLRVLFFHRLSEPRAIDPYLCAIQFLVRPRGVHVYRYSVRRNVVGAQIGEGHSISPTSVGHDEVVTVRYCSVQTSRVVFGEL